VLSERFGELLAGMSIMARNHNQVGQRFFQLANLRKRRFELLGVTNPGHLIVVQWFKLVR
jgi:hypothetical protein